jgi:hypothetical protein
MAASGAPEEVHHHGHHEQDEEHEEENLRYSGAGSGDSAESERAGDERDDEEDRAQYSMMNAPCTLPISSQQNGEGGRSVPDVEAARGRFGRQPG